MVVAASEIEAGGAVGGTEAAEGASASTAEEKTASGAGSKRAQRRRQNRRNRSGNAPPPKKSSYNPVRHPIRTAQTVERIEQAPAVGTVQLISKHSHEGILFWSFALLVLSTWSGFWQPTINTIWKGDPWKTPIDGKLILGGILFAIVLAMIADTSDDAASLITWVLVALWLLFLMFNGGSVIQNFFGWFQSGTTSNATAAAQQQSALQAVADAILGKSSSQPTQQQQQQALQRVGKSILPGGKS